MIVALLHSAVLERDLLRHELAEAIDHGALAQAVSSTRIDNVAADIASDPDLVDLHLLVRADRDLRHFGEVARVAEMESHTHARALRQRALAPTRLLCGKFHH